MHPRRVQARPITTSSLIWAIITKIGISAFFVTIKTLIRCDPIRESIYCLHCSLIKVDMLFHERHTLFE